MKGKHVPYQLMYGAYSAPRGNTETDQNVQSICQTPAGLQNMIIKYLSVGQWFWFSYQQVALNVLFQMRYESIPNSNKQPSDSLKAEATSVFTTNQDFFAIALHSEVQLGSAGMPLHFDLSLCNLLEYSRPPYIS